jgi:hypothetical protein
MRASIAPGARGNYVPRSFLFLPSYSLIRGRFLITLTLDEGTLDMMLGDEHSEDFYDVSRHRHGFTCKEQGRVCSRIERCPRCGHWLSDED